MNNYGGLIPPQLRGDWIIASFIVNQQLLVVEPRLHSILIDSLAKNNLHFVGAFCGGEYIDISDENITVTKLVSTDELIVELFFSGAIGAQMREFRMDLYDYRDGFVRIDLSTSHEYLEEDGYLEKNVLSFLELSRPIYHILKPEYGLIGQEEFAYSPISINNCMADYPLFWGYYGKSLVETIGRLKLNQALEGSYIKNDLEDGGVFFAISNWTTSDISKEEFKKRKDKLQEIVAAIKKC